MIRIVRKPGPSWSVAVVVATVSLIGLACVVPYSLRENKATALAQCRQSVTDVLLLPSNWQIEACEPGDWSGDFTATVATPPGLKEREVFARFKKSSRRTFPESGAAPGELWMTDDEYHLSIENAGSASTPRFELHFVAPK